MKVGIVGNVSYDNTNSSPRCFVSQCYIESIEMANATPFVIPYLENEETVKRAVKSMDAILITGGVDVNPILFGKEPYKKLGVVSDERDKLDYNIIKYASEFKKPILGICRGIQVLNTYFGGTLIQDIESETKSNIKHSQEARFDVVTHKIKTKEGSVIHKLLGDTAYVNSFHHQAIDKLADIFEVTAEASDGIIEAVESKEKENGFIMAFQFHPELLSKKINAMQNIFNFFIKNSR